jgi:hypothetical protein
VAASGSGTGHGEDMMVVGGTGQGVHRVTEGGVAITGPCWFECGQKATQNIGSARYPKLVCGPCRACARALMSQVNAADNPDVKKTYSAMVRTKPDQYKTLIRSSRITTSADIPGVSTLAARDAQLSFYTQRIVTEVPQHSTLQYQKYSVKHSCIWLDCRL